MTPLALGKHASSSSLGVVEGVNAIDINPAHNLFAFATDGPGTVEFWDPRSRSPVGILRLPTSLVSPSIAARSVVLPGVDDDKSLRGLAATALASRKDGLSLAVGTSTGHTLLYDIRSPKPYATKDQGYGLPIKRVQWIEGPASRMAGEHYLCSADKKVLKIWDRDTPTNANFASITTPTDVNDFVHVEGSGLFMCANEGMHMTSYYVPQLGPAPKWCSFLDNLTEEMEDQTVRNTYEDFKFVDKTELSTCVAYIFF
jgi:ribosome biogenesis protein ENP2